MDSNSWEEQQSSKMDAIFTDPECPIPEADIRTIVKTTLRKKGI
jgi:hypothetical protein